MSIQKTLIISYPNPDLDGYACSFAYAELLNKTNKNAVGVAFGTPYVEVQYVLNNFEINPLASGEDILLKNKNCSVIFLDESSVSHLPPNISPDQVVEIIDHHMANEEEKFVNAKKQIEAVGSCATLVAERFAQSGLRPSREAVILLYGAIVSSTVNFKNKVTTERDKVMADWLLTLIDLPDDFVKNLFLSKSAVGDDLEQILYSDMKVVELARVKVCIFQLEISGVEKLLENRKDEIMSILKKKPRKSLFLRLFF